MSLDVLNAAGSKIITWVKVKDLPLNTPLLIESCDRWDSKYHTNGHIVVVIKDIGHVSLPGRFSDLDASAIDVMNSGKVHMIVKGAVGRTFNIQFE